jgi:hypothetical protein
MQLLLANAKTSVSSETAVPLTVLYCCHLLVLFIIVTISVPAHLTQSLTHTATNEPRTVLYCCHLLLLFAIVTISVPANLTRSHTHTHTHFYE